MARLRTLWVIAPLLLGACSFINAPDEIDPGTGGGGTGGAGGTGGETGGTGGTTTSEMAVCGDGKVTGDEACDDDNTTPGDGCSAECAEETGFTCTEDDAGLSTCQKNCGNGVLDADEQCDDGGKGDDATIAGDEDPCDDECRFKEFDIEASDNTAIVNEVPTAAFRRDADTKGVDQASFYAIWRTTAGNKIRGRQYKFDGTPLLGTASVDFSDLSASDPDGHVMCTAASNRSLFFWRDPVQDKIMSERFESNSGKPGPQVSLGFVDPEPNPSCATSPAPDNTFVVATTKPSSTLTDVFVQPFSSFGAPMGAPVDIGDALAPNDTAAWGLTGGFMVAWAPDPDGAGFISAQQLDKNGLPVPGAVHQMTDAADLEPREMVGGLLGPLGNGSRFVVVYTRLAEDMSHREVVFRIFSMPDPSTPPVGSAPVVVAAGTNEQSEPRLGVNPTTKKFVVVWTALANQEDVLYRVFDEEGAPLTEPTTANELQVGKQLSPGVAVDPMTGHVAIVWGNDIANDTKPPRISGKVFANLLQ